MDICSSREVIGKRQIQVIYDHPVGTLFAIPVGLSGCRPVTLPDARPSDGVLPYFCAYVSSSTQTCQRAYKSDSPLSVSPPLEVQVATVALVQWWQYCHMVLGLYCLSTPKINTDLTKVTEFNLASHGKHLFSIEDVGKVTDGSSCTE